MEAVVAMGIGYTKSANACFLGMCDGDPHRAPPLAGLSYS
jgi:hypothetical protein